VWAEAAKQGYAEAPLDAAKAIEFSTNGDPQEAVSWYHIAADLGNAEAQYRLGTIYSEQIGIFKRYGIEADSRKAGDFFLLSSKQGNVEAQCQLGLMYFEGIGVLQDYEEGYAWWIVALANGYTDALDLMEMMQEKMTPHQTERAQQRAKQIWAGILD
jgi:TPR repeat protein